MSSFTSRTATVVTGGRETESRRRTVAGSGDPSLVDVARHAWRLLIVLGIVGAIAGYVMASRQSDTYSVGADMFIETPPAAQENGFDALRFTRNQADLINSAALRAEVRRIVGPDRYRRLQPAFHATPSENSDVVHLGASASSARGAVVIARAVKEGYQALNRSEVRAARDATLTQRASLRAQLTSLEDGSDSSSVEAQRDSIANQLAAVDAALAGYEAQLARGTFGVRRYQPPDVPDAPSSPAPRRTGLLSGVFAVVAALGAMYGRALLRPRAFLAKHAAARLGVTMLAHGAGVTTRSSGHGVDEIYDSVLRLCLARLGEGTPAIGVTSVGPESTQVAAGLAAAGARAHWHATVLDIAPSGGQSSIARSEAQAQYRVFSLPAHGPLGSAMHPLDEIIGSPNALVVANLPGMRDAGTLELAQRLSCLVVVVTSHTDLRDLDTVIERARFVGVDIIGFIYDDRPAGHFGPAALRHKDVADVRRRAPAAVSRPTERSLERELRTSAPQDVPTSTFPPARGGSTPL
jgi:hypothetical protein